MSFFRFRAGLGRWFSFALAAALSLGLLAGPASAGGKSAGTDTCFEPDQLEGDGIFFFITAGATPDADPISPGCDFGNSPGFGDDVWYCWTAPCSGNVLISFWGLSDPSTKFAVYDGCDCPPDESSVIACGFNSATFSADEGSTYLIRIGGLINNDFGEFILACVGDGSVACKSANDECQEPDQLGHGSSNTVGFQSSPYAFVTDDFLTMTGGLISSVCWWGAYFDDSGDCSFGEGGPHDSFEISYYLDYGGAPGPLAFGPFPVVPFTFETDNVILTGQGPLTEFQYEASHPAFEISPGQCLWISITNNLDSHCSWMWTTAPGGDLRAAYYDGKFLFSLDVDFAFCIDAPTHPYGCDQLAPPDNDDCSNALSIPQTKLGSAKVIEYDTSIATTDGPDHFNCLYYGEPGIRDDVWYCWTAPASGEIIISSCGLTSIDSKIAVYGRCNCPVDDFDLIACDDDFCGVQSSVTLTVFEGLDYLIRVGSWPRAPGGPGAFELKYTIIELPEPQEFLADGASIIEDVGDLDNDGDTDVVVVIPDLDPDRLGRIQVFLNLGNDGDGDWLGLAPQDPILVGHDPSGVAIGHYSDDDFLDVAVTNRGDDTVGVYLNDGFGGFSFAFDLFSGKDPSAIAAGDFTNDGLVDLAVANEFDATVKLFNQNPLPPLGPAGGFTDGEVMSSGGEAPVALEPEDVDNDKDVDLIVVNKGSSGNGNVTTVQFQNGSSSGQVSAGAGAQPGGVATGNIDGDDLPDTAVSNRGGGTVSVFLSDSLTLGPTEIPVGDDPRSIDIVDLDGDGDGDLVVAADDEVVGPAVQVIANLLEGGDPPFGSTPAFGPPVGYLVNANPNFVASADFDNDGTFDIVTANTDDGETGGSVTVLLNSPPPDPCGADFDGSGDIGFADMVNLLLAWGPCEGMDKCKYDVNGDGDVGFGDLKELMIYWGGCRPE